MYDYIISPSIGNGLSYFKWAIRSIFEQNWKEKSKLLAETTFLSPNIEILVKDMNPYYRYYANVYQKSVFSNSKYIYVLIDKGLENS